MGRFDKYKFHCSSLGDIMTESKNALTDLQADRIKELMAKERTDKQHAEMMRLIEKRDNPELGETVKAHLLECWITETYGRRRELENQYVEKGHLQEDDGITLYSRVTSTFYKKNEEVFENDFIIGTPDIIHDNIVRDIKCSWSIFTFFETIQKPMNKAYKYQVNGYWDLIPGCEGGRLVYTLVNNPDVLIEQAKSRLRFKLGIIDADIYPTYLEACEMIDKNSIFDDIPIEERWIEFEVPRLDMRPVYERVKECREFMNKLP